MVESRWLRLIGPGVVALGAVALSLRRRSAPADRSWVPPPCAGRRRRTASRPGPVPGPRARRRARRAPGSASTRSSAATVPCAGQRLSLGLGGRPGRHGRWSSPASRSRPARSVASSWSARMTVCASRLHAVDVARRLRLGRRATTADVIRRATIDPAGHVVYETRVDRATRADLGVWRVRSMEPVSARRVLPPLPARRPLRSHVLDDVHLGRDRPTPRGPVVRRGRLPDAGPRPGRRGASLDRDDLGSDPIGLDEDRLVTYAACRGLPCPIVATDLVAEASGGCSSPTADRLPWSRRRTDRRLVDEVAGAHDRRLRAVAVDGSAASDLGLLPDGLELLVPDAAGRAATRAARPAGSCSPRTVACRSTPAPPPAAPPSPGRR